MKAADLHTDELVALHPGRLELQGRRLILHDVHALALFRRDLIESMGLEQARRVLTRKGFFWGQTDAAAMEKLGQWDHPAEWLQAGARLLQIAGLANVSIKAHHLQPGSRQVHLEATWNGSVEVEEHRMELGAAIAPVCWVITGYVSGYASYCVGGTIYFVEECCEATGSAQCRAVGKDLVSWGPDIGPHVVFFHAADIQQRVRDLTEPEETAHTETPGRVATGAANHPHYRLTPGLEARSSVFRRTVDLASRVARFNTTVLILGETGTGKEVLARHIHHTSPRATQPLLAVNCSALPETLLESELFGHRAGAFTGATRNRMGLFEEAQGGTVFLDEIGDISPGMQAKLLRVLQEREIRRVGESQNRPVDVRVIAATNQDLEALVAAGRFREDLFYRLNVVQIRIPPLRERPEDILPLARRFLRQCTEEFGLKPLQLAPGCVDRLLHYAWPGNVRELENAIEHAAVMCPDSLITPDLLPLQTPAARTGRDAQNTAVQRLEELEYLHILESLERNQGNRSRTAKELGIGEATLYRRLRKAGAASSQPSTRGARRLNSPPSP